MTTPLAHWEPVWRWVALWEMLILLLIAHGIVQDWLYPPEKWDWTDHIWGQITEELEDRQRCGEGLSGCPQHVEPQ